MQGALAKLVVAVSTRYTLEGGAWAHNAWSPGAWLVATVMERLLARPSAPRVFAGGATLHA